MTFKEYAAKYGAFFTSVCNKTAINPAALLTLSYQQIENKPQLLKVNNLFAVQNGGKLKTYKTPFEAIENAIQVITANPEFTRQKIGTLRANPKLQFKKIRAILAN